MYINKTSIPSHLGIDHKKLTDLLMEANKKYGNFWHSVNYDGKYLIEIKMTYRVHKSRGMEWKISSIDAIDKNEEIICNMY